MRYRYDCIIWSAVDLQSVSLSINQLVSWLECLWNRHPDNVVEIWVSECIFKIIEVSLECNTDKQPWHTVTGSDHQAWSSVRRKACNTCNLVGCCVAKTPGCIKNHQHYIHKSSWRKSKLLVLNNVWLILSLKTSSNSLESRIVNHTYINLFKNAFQFIIRKML